MGTLPSQFPTLGPGTVLFGLMACVLFLKDVSQHANVRLARGACTETRQEPARCLRDLAWPGVDAGPHEPRAHWPSWLCRLMSKAVTSVCSLGLGVATVVEYV